MSMLLRLAFVRVAEEQGHHPDIEIHWNKVTLSLWTHAIQGLHGTKIALPRAPVHRPDLELVERRYQRFRESAAGSLTI